MSMHTPLASLRDKLKPLNSPADLERVLGEESSPQFWWKNREQGTGPAYCRIGVRSIAYPVDSVVAWFESQLQSQGQPNTPNNELKTGAEGV